MVKELKNAALGSVKNRHYRFNFVAILHALEGSTWHKYLTTEQKVKTILMYMDKAEIQLTKVKNIGAINRKRIQTASAAPNQFATVQSMVFIKLSEHPTGKLSYKNCRLCFKLGTEELPFSVNIHSLDVFLHENKMESYGNKFYHWLCTPVALRHGLERITIS